MTTEQKVAVQGRPHSDTEVLFEQTVKGWVGSGFDYSHRTLEGTFWHSANVAQIKFTVSDHVAGMEVETTVGTIILSEKDATTFALAVAPKDVKQKLELFDELSVMVRRVGEWDDGDLPVRMTADLLALIAKIDNIGKE